MVVIVRTSEVGRVYENRKQQPKVALDDFSLEIGANEIHGLLGPNGAGKSTLVKILATVLLPTSGTAEILGHDVVDEADKVRGLIGVVFGGERGLYTRISARQNLLFWGALYKMSQKAARQRADALLERLGLADRSNEPVERFSRGMKQRLHLARGLLHQPQVVFLDEPTSGLDPVAATDFHQLIRELRDEGRTILLATHDMGEASALCDRVTMIDHGKLILTGATSEVGRFLGERECVDYTCPDPGLAEQLALLSCVLGVDKRDGPHKWRAYSNGPQGTRDILRWLIDRGVLSASRSEPTLEEVYLHAIGDRGMRV
jgi:ABC-2 type transport system ATP-binding protein